MKPLTLEVAANGHLWLQSHAKNQAWRISFLLMFRYGFWRWGSYVPAITDEAIYPGYRRFGLLIFAGWDHWAGYDFLSGNHETDVFLRDFANRHLSVEKSAAAEQLLFTLG